MTTASEVRKHDHPVYYCAACRDAFTPSEADAATGIQDDGSTRCPNCNAILYAEPHLEECKRMELELANSYSNSSGITAANAFASETWNGKLGSKCFTVTLNSMDAPKWEGDDLDEDERDEVMNELSERSGL